MPSGDFVQWVLRSLKPAQTKLNKIIMLHTSSKFPECIVTIFSFLNNIQCKFKIPLKRT